MNRTLSESHAHTTEDVQDRFLRINAALMSLHAFFSASKKVEPKEFEIFCAEITRDHAYVHTTAWVPSPGRDEAPLVFPSRLPPPTPKKDSFIGTDLSSVGKLHFYTAGGRGIFYLETPGGDGFYIAIRGEDMLPKSNLGVSLKTATLHVQGKDGTMQVAVRHAGTGDSPVFSLTKNESADIDSVGLKWRYDTVLLYRPGLEDWILPILALIFAIVGASAVYFQLQIREDRAFRLEQNLRAQRMSMLGTVAGGIVHDFNNVLVGIVGTLSIVKDLMSESLIVRSADLERPVGVMERAADRGSKILARLVGLAKPDRDPKHPMQLSGVLEEVVELAQGTAGRDIAIELSIEDSAKSLFIMGNATQLEQVFLNLVVNGIHAMTIMRGEDEPQSGALRIRVESFYPDRRFVRRHSYTSDRKSFAKVIVSDTGVGMDAKTIQRLFTPFFSTKDRSQGTGLGLAGVYVIVKSHNGYVEVDSTPGKGSQFSVFLPCIELEKAT